MQGGEGNISSNWVARHFYVLKWHKTLIETFHWKVLIVEVLEQFCAKKCRGTSPRRWKRRRIQLKWTGRQQRLKMAGKTMVIIITWTWTYSMVEALLGLFIGPSLSRFLFTLHIYIIVCCLRGMRGVCIYQSGSYLLGRRAQNLSILFLNALTEGALTTSDGRLFHVSKTLSVKKLFRKLFFFPFSR